jgi:acyl-CoA thioesterase
VHNPFGHLVGFRTTQVSDGFARAELDVRAELYNPHDVLHGGVIFSMVDNSMGAAVYTRLTPEETCSTIEVKLNFLKAVRHGRLVCDTHVVARGRRTAVLRSAVTLDGVLVATAQGTYAIQQKS